MSRSPLDGKVECPRCGLANYPRAPYCVECHEPLDDPEDDEADDEARPRRKGKRSGKRKRRPREQPRSLVVVVGVWLLFGPVALYCVVTLLEMLPEGLRDGLRNPEERGAFLLFLAVMGLGLYLPFTIIRRVTLGYLQEQSRRRKKRKTAERSDDD